MTFKNSWHSSGQAQFGQLPDASSLTKPFAEPRGDLSLAGLTAEG